MSFAATVLTLYPDMFPGPLGMSLAGRALAEGAWSLDAVNIRDFATDRHRTVDDTPAGGGAGMVLRADVLAAAIDSVADERPVLAMSPRGAPLTQARVRQLASGPGVTILCGRFEGFDERIFEARAIEQVSIGNYILSNKKIKTLPSKSYQYLNMSCDGAVGSKTCGDTNSFKPLVARSGEKATLGAVSASVLVVRQFGSPPEDVVAQPVGKAGAMTESKFWVSTIV